MDGLKDYEEVDWVHLKNPSSNVYECWTYYDWMETYHPQDMSNFTWINSTKTIKVLPITSNPWDKDSDGDGIDDKDDYEKLIPFLSETLFYQTQKLPGYDKDGNIAEDMMSNDMSIEDFRAKSLTRMVEDIESCDEKELKDRFNDLLLFYARDGGYYSEYARLATKFYNASFNGGKDFKDDLLNKLVSEEPSMINYIDAVKALVIDELSKYCGDLRSVTFNHKTNKNRCGDDHVFKYMNSEVNRPIFDDLFRLKILINDTWGNYVEITDYQFDGTNFNGKLRFTVYDHFGLDYNDIDPKTKWLNYAQDGFRAWYILQHYDGFSGNFKPFIDYSIIEVEFNGKV